METLVTQALVNGHAAAGASQIKPGFAISPEDVIERNQRIIAKQKDLHSHWDAVEWFGRIRSARAARMLLWLATKSKAKTEALGWLKRHEAVFDPFLEEIRAGGPDDAKLVDGVRKKVSKLELPAAH